jgi:hypothetical protein
MTDEEIERWSRWPRPKRRAIIRIRRDPKFGGVRPEADEWDGREVIVEFAWEFEPDERAAYREAGDVAWLVVEPREYPLLWLATGDLEFLDNDLRPKNGSAMTSEAEKLQPFTSP